MIRMIRLFFLSLFFCLNIFFLNGQVWADFGACDAKYDIADLPDLVSPGRTWEQFAPHFSLIKYKKGALEPLDRAIFKRLHDPDAGADSMREKIQASIGAILVDGPNVEPDRYFVIADSNTANQQYCYFRSTEGNHDVGVPARKDFYVPLGSNITTSPCAIFTPFTDPKDTYDSLSSGLKEDLIFAKNHHGASPSVIEFKVNTDSSCLDSHVNFLNGLGVFP